ncbi:hypothetical protein CRQ34_22415 [Salmonella enterica subsp. enterica serovar Livingstone]|nr:hypothetical protein [Salmonella enterica subsp. enterica serovar Livingstone]
MSFTAEADPVRQQNIRGNTGRKQAGSARFLIAALWRRGPGGAGDSLLQARRNGQTKHMAEKMALIGHTK